MVPPLFVLLLVGCEMIPKTLAVRAGIVGGAGGGVRCIFQSFTGRCTAAGAAD